MNVTSVDWLPSVFIGLMGLSFLIYAILDGYDLGVGVLLPLDKPQQRDTMIYSIGPFWDANETWLVMAIGLLLIAFPKAHSIIFQALYLPTALMLAGLILRGVSFDFRTKAPSTDKHKWDYAFKFGSLLATLTQGYMLGRYITSFEDSWLSIGFSALSAICVTAGYCFIGAAWLVMKTEGELQRRAANWAKITNVLMAVGIIAVCLTNLLIDQQIMDKWLGGMQVLILIPITLLLAFTFITVHLYLDKVPMENDLGCWFPFLAAIILFIMCFCGLAYSFYPYIVPFKMTIFEAASARESLWFIFVGAAVVLPMIIGYTIFSYKVFWGKTSKLNY
ncbi:cytochrome d ubiquinol oxidase subunit II [Cognaticolwellia aestuarii]|jgi:cytochrome bd ubiquinol oxidase subunit II|uniref:cytochrome d ubiquinol oxidase subunit II n=1 Tax=Cognaticolwellia aestuarii TaxID=329993 RepID=UPI00098645C8|nr:cytochrome d ubiquinol oxidase subunit II [Cognaticolwellia aestuarii]|tara:strand:- start:3479 stop:4480 length:1002 start_codon:yes stop_codon:yes gene_type:complete